jgi:excisionase family DNA binding protein
MTHPDLLTTGEVAKILHVGPDTVTRWANAGRLAAVILPSGRHRFRRADVDAILGVEPDADESVPA